MEQAYLLVLLVMQNISEWALTAECLMFFYDELCKKLQYHNYARVLGYLYTSVVIVCHSISRRQKYYLFSFTNHWTYEWRIIATDAKIDIVRNVR